MARLGSPSHNINQLNFYFALSLSLNIITYSLGFLRLGVVGGQKNPFPYGANGLLFFLTLQGSSITNQKFSLLSCPFRGQDDEGFFLLCVCVITGGGGGIACGMVYVIVHFIGREKPNRIVQGEWHSSCPVAEYKRIWNSRFFFFRVYEQSLTSAITVRPHDPIYAHQLI